MLNHYIDLHTLPKTDPIWDCWKLVSLQRKRRFFPSPFKIMKEAFAIIPVQDMETIEPFCLPPWQRLRSSVVKIHENREKRLNKQSSSRMAPVGTGWSGSGWRWPPLIMMGGRYPAPSALPCLPSWSARPV